MNSRFVFLFFFLSLFQFQLINSLLPQDCKCLVQQSRRIVNGQLTTISHYPWQVSLARSEKNVCGGIIINHFWILTAQKCVPKEKRNNKLKIRVGNTNYPATLPNDIYYPKKIVYDKISALENKEPWQFALIRLDRHLTFNSNVQPACLGTKFEHYDDGYFTTTGWGSPNQIYKEKDDSRYSTSENLNELTSYYENPSRHGSSYKLPPECLLPNYLCARSLFDNNFVCYGDFGGPLNHALKGYFTVVGVGVHSFPLVKYDGTQYCSDLAGYTRISSSMDFIEKHIGKKDYCKSKN